MVYLSLDELLLNLDSCLISALKHPNPVLALSWSTGHDQTSTQSV
jgi:hypothetical protein